MLRLPKTDGVFATCVTQAHSVMKGMACWSALLLDDLRIQLAPLMAESSGIMAQLVWVDH